MALKATVFKLRLHIADMDRHYYNEHAITIARHPSETDLRMMIRIAAFALNASESLSFCKGISTDDEPDLWQKSLSDEIELWIELGQLDEKRIRQASAKAHQMKIYTYQEKAASVWRDQMAGKVSRFSNLEIASLQFEEDTLTALAERNMEITATIQDGELSLSSTAGNTDLKIDRWL